MKRREFLAALAAAGMGTVAAGVLGGCSSSESDAGATAIRIGYVPWIGYGGWFIADRLNYFTDAGLKVELVAFNTDADKNAALASGDIDALNVAAHGALQLIENGVDLRVVLLEDASTAADAVLASAGITSIRDLAGKSVAYEEITTSDILLHALLTDAGMSMSDITPVPMKASEAGSALIAGRVDAAVTYEPYISEALAAGSDLHVIASAGEKPGLISDVLVVRSDFLETNEQAIQHLVDTWGQGIDYYKANQDDAQKIIADGVQADRESLITAFDGMTFFDLAQNATDLSGEFSQVTLPMVAEAAVEAGILTEVPDFEPYVDDSFVKGTHE